MAKFSKLNELFAIEESSDGRFLVDRTSKPYTRLVEVGDKYSELCCIQSAEQFAAIRPSNMEYKRDIWMYNADEKVGILYVSHLGKIKSYVIPEVPFTAKDNVYLINDNFIVYNYHDTKGLYFRGEYVGTLSYFFPESVDEYSICTNNGLYEINK